MKPRLVQNTRYQEIVDKLGEPPGGFAEAFGRGLAQLIGRVPDVRAHLEQITDDHLGPRGLGVV